MKNKVFQQLVDFCGDGVSCTYEQFGQLKLKNGVELTLNERLTGFDISMEHFKFDRSKPINIIECFSGIGTQAMAWKRLAKKYDLKLNFMAISEIDKYAIQSYNAIHGETYNLGGIGGFERFPKDIDFISWSFPCQEIGRASCRERV